MSNGGTTAGDPAAGMQVTNMGRVLLLASLSTILFMGNANFVAAQGHGGTAVSGGGVGAHASGAPAGAVHGSAMAPGRAVGRVTSSPGSHLAIPRSPSGQIMPRRAGTIRGSGRPSRAAGTRAPQFRSPRGAGVDFADDSNVPGL